MLFALQQGQLGRRAASAAGGGSDVNYSNVILRLPLDGTDGATATTDFSPDARTITFNGNAQLDTAVVKYGSAALLVDGTDDYLSCTVDDLGTGDFTIDLWVRPSAQTRRFPTIMHLDDGADLLYVQYDHEDHPDKFRVLINSTAYVCPATSATGAWYFLSVTRQAGAGVELQIWLDGVAQLGANTNATNFSTGSGLTCEIGGSADSTELSFLGSIDDVRITKSVARYSSNFTPPAAAMPTS